MIFFDDGDGKIYFLQNKKKIYVTEQEKDKLSNGCIYKNGAVVETQKYKDFLLQQEKMKIELDFIEKIRQITEKYPKEEREGWDLQLKEAEKVINGGTSIIIDELAKANGITSLEFAKLVKQKADAFATAYAKALAEKQKRIKNLKV